MLLIGLYFCSGASAECFLVLRSKTKLKETYLRGSEISILIKQQWLDLQIDSIQDNYFVAEGIKYQYNEIEAVKKYGHSFNYNSTSLSAAIGAAFVLFVEAGNKIGKHKSFVPSCPTVAISSTLLGSAILLQIFKERIFKLDKKFKLAVSCPA